MMRMGGRIVKTSRHIWVLEVAEKPGGWEPHMSLVTRECARRELKEEREACENGARFRIVKYIPHDPMERYRGGY